MAMKIALIGFGTVGQGFVEIIAERSAQLQRRYGFMPRIVAVATRSRGTLYSPAGLDPAALLSAIQTGSLAAYPDGPGLQRDLDTLDLIRDCNADVVIEATVSNLETAQPALSYCYTALESGKHLVLANKGPVALAYDSLRDAARNAGRILRFEATVMAGTPSIALALDSLAGCEIRAARGILNGTTNYILTQMESGMEYAEALAQAQALGYAEADPHADVEGWDAASKVLILASTLFGARLTLDDLDVSGISQISSADIEAAQAAGERYKLIAEATPQGGSVRAMRLPLSNPLAGVSGAANALMLDTDLLGPVTLIGAGAGRQETGFALLGDLLAIERLLAIPNTNN